MNVADVWRALVRHPVWIALGLVLAVAAGGATFTVVKPQQESTASVVIVPPTLGDDIASQNPFLNLDNTLAQLATVVGSALQSDAGRAQLDAAGGTAAFSIANVTGDNPSFAQLSPELQFTVTDASAVVAERTAAALVLTAATTLTALQDRAGVPAGARARVVTVSTPSGASVAGDGQIRAAGGVGIIVAVLVAVLIVLADVGVTRRRRRRELSADVRRYRVERPARTDPDRTRVTP